MAVPEDYDGPTFEYEGERYPFDPTTMLGSQVKMLKSRTGMSFIQYTDDLEDLGAESVGFYIWMQLTMQQKDPPKYSEFDYDYSAFLASLEGFSEDPTPPPNRAARRKATKKTTKPSSGDGRRSSRTTAESLPTGS